MHPVLTWLMCLFITILTLELLEADGGFVCSYYVGPTFLIHKVCVAHVVRLEV